MDCRKIALTKILEKIKGWKPLSHFTFTKDYCLAIGVIISSACLLSLILLMYQHKVSSEQHHYHLQSEAERLEQALIHIFEENRRVMTYIGQQIASHPSQDLKWIAHILKEANAFKSASMEDDITPSYFSWANAQGHIIVTGHAGVLPHPIDLSYRDYFKKCQHFPWMLQINPPGASTFRKTPSLPIGLGVTDKSGQFLGFIPVGLRVKSLLQLLKKTLINPKSDFIVCDHELNVTLYTGHDTMNPSLLKDLPLLNYPQGFLRKPLLHQNVAYAFYKKMRGYPCIILTGANQALAIKSFYTLVLPQISALFILALIMVFTLYAFQRRISSRLALLVEKTIHIAKGKIDSEVPLSSLQETKSLAEGLNQIVKCMHKKNLNEQKLLETLTSIEGSDKAGRKFIQKLQNEWNMSLDFIIKSSEILLHSHQGHFEVGMDFEKQEKLLENLHLSALSLKSLKASPLKESRVNLNTLLEESLLITLKFAIFHQVILKTQFQANLPYLKADPLHLQHIFVSLLCSAIELSPKGGTIKLSTAFNKDNVSLTIEDGGFGLESQDLSRIHPHLKEGTLNWETGYPCLSQEQIEELITMQGGYLKVKSQWGKGRIVTLTFPSYAENPSVENPTDKLPSNVYLLPKVALKKHD